MIFSTIDHIDATINLAMDIAEVGTLLVYDRNSVKLCSFMHSIESLSRLLTMLGTGVARPAESWKLPPTFVFDNHAVMIRSEWLLHPPLSNRTAFQNFSAALPNRTTGRNRQLQDSCGKS